MKKILIIGGTGTISSPITKQLANDPNMDVYVLNRGNKQQELPNNVTSLIGDFNDLEHTKTLLAPYSFDCVINFIIMSVEQVKASIELCKDKAKQFIYISTVCVLNHETTCLIDEKTERGNAYSSYGRTKASCEDIFLQAKADINFPVTIVRPTQTYSESRIPLSVKGRSCWPVVKRMMEGKEVIVHGDGQSLWASTHADDFVKGFINLVGNQATIGETYQIMNPQPHTWDMVYQCLANLLHVTYKPVYIGTDILRLSQTYDFEGSIQGDKRWSNIFDISKIKTISPDFTCSIDLEDGLRMYLEYMEAHPELKVEEPAFDAWCDQCIANYKRLVKELKDKL